MKTLKPLFLLAIFAILFSSCKKSGSDSSSDTPTTSMSFKLNGVAEKNGSVLPVATYYTSYGTNSLQVVGKFNVAEGINISLENPKVGTYDVVKDNLLVTYSSSNEPGLKNMYIATTGTITITAFNTTSVSGTFSFTGANPDGQTKVITEGKFTVTSIIKL